MYWIKIKKVETGEETTLEFETKEAAKLYRDYHCFFDAWDKRESWIAERFLTSEHKKLIVEEKIDTKLNSKKEEIEIKYYKIKPLYHFIEDNLGLKRTQLMWDALREERSLVLAQTDWTQIADNQMDTKTRHLYREYRQYLRNFPLGYNDSSVEIYKVMSFEEWKEFFHKN
jgi:hypothetical protein